jgi:NADH:ubiquinone oxidoreductase subunit 2 (subunit N)
VSLYYYLQVLKRSHVRPAPETASPIAPSPGVQLGVVLLALGVIGFGCFPNLLVGPLIRALAAAAL